MDQEKLKKLSQYQNLEKLKVSLFEIDRTAWIGDYG